MLNNFKNNRQTMIIIFITCLLTIPSLSYASSMFDDFKSGEFGNILEKREIRNWNEVNKNKITFDNSKLGCSGYKNKYERPKDCMFSSTITNNSDEYISYVVVKIEFMNKTTEKVIVEKKETFKMPIIPTATKEIKVYFDNSNFKQIPEQLVDNWAWNFEFLGAIPQDMTFSSSDYNWL